MNSKSNDNNPSENTEEREHGEIPDEGDNGYEVRDEE